MSFYIDDGETLNDVTDFFFFFFELIISKIGRANLASLKYKSRCIDEIQTVYRYVERVTRRGTIAG